MDFMDWPHAYTWLSYHQNDTWYIGLCTCINKLGLHIILMRYITIELDLNGGVNPFGQIRRQDTKIGGCHLAFVPLLLFRGKGWTASLVENVTTSKCSAHLKLPPIIWVNLPIGAPLFSPALQPFGFILNRGGFVWQFYHFTCDHDATSTWKDGSNLFYVIQIPWHQWKKEI